MAPAVFVPKKSRELSICIDYRELNKQAYPLPLPDKVQDCLAGSTIFSTLELQNGYWQLPVRQKDQEKQLSALVQEWGYISFAKCLLV